MPKKFIIQLLLLVCVSHSWAQQDLPIHKIIFTGNEHFSDAALTGKIVERSHKGFKRIVFWRKPQVFSERIMERDTERLRRFYFTQGYLKVNIRPQFTVTPKNKILVEFAIQENAPLIIHDVIYAFRDSLIQPEALQELYNTEHKIVKVQPGEQFRDADLIASENKLSKFLADAGYAYVQMQSKFELAADSTQVTIRFVIQTGPPCLFGATKISGNDKTPGKAILRQSTLDSSKTFSEKEILKSQRQIYGLGVFRFVSVKTELNEAQTPTLPVEILVEEAPRWTTKIGVGYGLEDELRTFAEIQKLGFVWPTGRISTKLKHSALEPYGVDVKWTKPAFLQVNDNFVINPFARREKEPAFTVDRYGGAISYQRRIGTHVSTSLSHLVEQVNLDVSTATRIETLESSDISIYNKSISNLHVEFDNSAPPFSPNRGIFAGVNLDLAGLLFQSDFQYMKMSVEGRHYHQLAGGLIAAVRLKGGFINPTGGMRITPIEERFFSGGSSSVRGWARSQLGPKNNEGTPTGGNSLVEANAELRFPVYKSFSGVIFYDTGNVWEKEFYYNARQLQSAAGVGARLSTPIGPIRLDVGFPISKHAGAQIHLSVGQAF